jgi:uncharacterized membrane protein
MAGQTVKAMLERCRSRAAPTLGDKLARHARRIARAWSLEVMLEAASR